MEIELVPDPGPDDPAALAALAALAREGLGGEQRPYGLGGAWRRAGLVDAIDRDSQRETPVYRGSSRRSLTPG